MMTGINGKVIKNEALGMEYTLAEITQGSLEIYEHEIAQEFEALKNIEAAAFRGTVVRAAIKAGWLPLEVDVITGMKPYEVKWLSTEITGHVREANEIPGE